jgi:predicted Zn-ribbon and HTH transcriptional regulator
MTIKDVDSEGQTMKALVRLRCADCGYGVSARSAPDSCPMCRGTAWDKDPRRHLASLPHDLLHLARREKQPSR